MEPPPKKKQKVFPLFERLKQKLSKKNPGASARRSSDESESESDHDTPPAPTVTQPVSPELEIVAAAADTGIAVEIGDEGEVFNILDESDASHASSTPAAASRVKAGRSGESPYSVSSMSVVEAQRALDEGKSLEKLSSAAPDDIPRPPMGKFDIGQFMLKQTSGVEITEAEKVALLRTAWRPGKGYKMPYNFRVNRNKVLQRTLREDDLIPNWFQSLKPLFSWQS